jgi:hypothetical protein
MSIGIKTFTAAIRDTVIPRVHIVLPSASIRSDAAAVLCNAIAHSELPSEFQLGSDVCIFAGSFDYILTIS